MKSLKILVVDDSQTMRQELKFKLESLGHHIVAEASNGLEALEMVKQYHPDLVTLDIIMPEMDGIECYRALRNLSYPPRCLIVSALAQEPRVLGVYQTEIDVNHYLDKFCSEEELNEKIEMINNQTPLPIPLPQAQGESAT